MLALLSNHVLAIDRMNPTGSHGTLSAIKTSLFDVNIAPNSSGKNAYTAPDDMQHSSSLKTK
jgi:hypothetical protein